MVNLKYGGCFWFSISFCLLQSYLFLYHCWIYDRELVVIFLSSALVKQNWWLLVYLIILQLGVLKNIPQSLYILCNLNFLAQSVQISEFGQNGIHETVYELSLCMLGKFWKTFSIILIITIFKTEYSKEGEVQGIFSMLICKVFHTLRLLHHHYN